MFRTAIGAVACLVCLGLPACRSTPQAQKAGEIMADSTITATVQSKLTADRLSNFSRVDVDTENGVVSLSGVVQSDQQRSHAESIARQVKGVTRVENHLQIQRPGTKPGNPS